MPKYRQGIYRPQNPQKYSGNPTNIIYRSGLELSVFRWLDTNPSCLSWCSEETIIPYISPKDNRRHRYFVDLRVTFKEKDGQKKTYLIEVKPFAQTLPPKNTPKKRQATFLNEVMTYGVNQAKWEAAEAYCKKRGWTFEKITEKDLPGY